MRDRHTLAITIVPPHSTSVTECGRTSDDDDSVVVELELACIVMYQHSVSVSGVAAGHHK